jgi:hypothetical protein
MGYASARLHYALQGYSMVLVEEKTNGTWIHTHTLTVSTWRYVGLVMENSYPTPR